MTKKFKISKTSSGTLMWTIILALIAGFLFDGAKGLLEAAVFLVLGTTLTMGWIRGALDYIAHEDE